MTQKDYLAVNGITWFLVMIIIGSHAGDLADSLLKGVVIMIAVIYFGLLTLGSFWMRYEIDEKK